MLIVGNGFEYSNMFEKSIMDFCFELVGAGRGKARIQLFNDYKSNSLRTK